MLYKKISASQKGGDLTYFPRILTFCYYKINNKHNIIKKQKTICLITKIVYCLNYNL